MNKERKALWPTCAAFVFEKDKAMRNLLHDFSLIEWLHWLIHTGLILNKPILLIPISQNIMVSDYFEHYIFHTLLALTSKNFWKPYVMFSFHFMIMFWLYSLSHKVPIKVIEVCDNIFKKHDYLFSIDLLGKTFHRSNFHHCLRINILTSSLGLSSLRPFSVPALCTDSCVSPLAWQMQFVQFWVCVALSECTAVFLGRMMQSRK